MSLEPRTVLHHLFDVAVQAELPAKVIPPAVQNLRRPIGRTVVVGAGKASAAMARAFEEAWDGPLSGVVATRYGHSVPCQSIEIIESAHPVPDDAGLTAAKKSLSAVTGLTSDDLVVALLSGGGSSLLTLPAPGISLSEKRSITEQLLRSGASIAEINAVRKRLSGIKGGRLAAAAYPARVVTMVISDVVGDDPSTVASGPTVQDLSTNEDAIRTLKKYNIQTDRDLRERLSEPPKIEAGEIYVLASSTLSRRAALAEAQRLGLITEDWGDADGDAEVLARDHARRARSAPQNWIAFSGGETTVTVRGSGNGGRNVQYLAALAEELNGQPGVYALAADTDGIDGNVPIAGAVIDTTTIQRATSLGISLNTIRAENNAHTLFSALNDSLVTGPTLTNVNDFRAILRLSATD